MNDSLRCAVVWRRGWMLRDPCSHRSIRILVVGLRERDHLLDRRAQIASLSRVHGIEQIEIGEIDPSGHERGVVETHPLEDAWTDRAQLRTEHLNESRA